MNTITWGKCTLGARIYSLNTARCECLPVAVSVFSVWFYHPHNLRGPLRFIDAAVYVGPPPYSTPCAHTPRGSGRRYLWKLTIFHAAVASPGGKGQKEKHYFFRAVSGQSGHLRPLVPRGNFVFWPFSHAKHTERVKTLCSLSLSSEGRIYKLVNFPRGRATTSAFFGRRVTNGHISSFHLLTFDD